MFGQLQVAKGDVGDSQSTSFVGFFIGKVCHFPPSVNICCNRPLSNYASVLVNNNLKL